MLITAMASTRKEARQHIMGQQDPLIRLICQIYLYGDTQTLQHWRKELSAVVLSIMRNIVVKKGRLTKEAVVDALDQVALPPNVRLDYRSVLQDPAYQSLSVRREDLLDPSDVQVLINVLAEKVTQTKDQQLTPWEVADLLIRRIMSW